MASRALSYWRDRQLAQLGELEIAHRAVGGTGRGRRYATFQLNHGYVVAVASQFQAFCRNLHTEAADFLARHVHPRALEEVLHSAITEGRQIDRGNAQPSSLGADFNRLGMEFWNDVRALDARNAARQRKLEELNSWRNAIAHQDFDPQQLGGRTQAQLDAVRRWRSACEALATAFDRAVGDHLEGLIGQRPW